jgi:hypothetical protein
LAGIIKEFNMGGRTGEIILIAVVFVLLFGARRLPEMGAAISEPIQPFPILSNPFG